MERYGEVTDEFPDTLPEFDPTKAFGTSMFDNIMIRVFTSSF